MPTVVFLIRTSTSLQGSKLTCAQPWRCSKSLLIRHRQLRHSQNRSVMYFLYMSVCLPPQVLMRTQRQQDNQQHANQPHCLLNLSKSTNKELNILGVFTCLGSLQLRCKLHTTTNQTFGCPQRHEEERHPRLAALAIIKEK